MLVHERIRLVRLPLALTLWHVCIRVIWNCIGFSSRGSCKAEWAFLFNCSYLWMESSPSTRNIETHVHICPWAARMQKESAIFFFFFYWCFSSRAPSLQCPQFTADCQIVPRQPGARFLPGAGQGQVLGGVCFPHVAVCPSLICRNPQLNSFIYS